MDPGYKQILERSRQVAVILTNRTHPWASGCNDFIKMNKELQWLLGNPSREAWEYWLLKQGELWVAELTKDGWESLWEEWGRRNNPWWNDF